MGAPRPFLLLTLALLPLALAAQPPSPDRALLALDRRVSNDLVAGLNATVEYNIHNVGKSAASKISLKDLSFPQSRFETFSGSFRNTWSTLAAGESCTLQVVMRPRRAGLLLVSPASVSYVDEEGVGRVTRLASDDTVVVEDLITFRRRTDRHQFEWVAFVGAFVLLVVAPFGFSSFVESGVDGAVGKKRN